MTSTGPHSDQYWYMPPTSTGTYLLPSTASLGDQYWFVLCFPRPLHDCHLKKKKSPDRSLDLSGEFLVVMIVGLDFTRAP